jgi:hypothetical protein
MLPVNFFLSDKKRPARKGCPIWTTPFPLNKPQSGKPLAPDTGNSLNYGDYFSAVRDFLRKNKFEIVLIALSNNLQRNVNLEDIKEINLYLKKHGAFYHPAKVEIILEGLNISFVLNVAVSSAGKSYIQKEYRLLNKLNNDFPFSFVPEVYGEGRVSTKDKQTFYMFLGKWLEGFNEFHLSSNPSDEKNKIIVWDTEKGAYFLSAEQALELYRKAAMILTCYYNIETLEQIYPWHHAAGDFVIKRDNDTLQVKLVSVRQYASLFKENAAGKKNRSVDFYLEAMLVFFLNLSIRMRLDRLDGIGEIVWAYDVAVEGTILGCYDGLNLNPSGKGFSEPFVYLFQNHLLSCSQSELFDLSHTLVNRYDHRAPEVPIIKKNLQEHVRKLYETINLVRIK